MRSTALGAVLLAALVSGCSSTEAAPAQVEPLASKPTADGNTEPTTRAVPEAGTAMPAEARLETALGAAAFARHYVSLIGEAFMQADSSRLQALTADGCEGCNAVIDVVNSLAPQGRRRVGGEYLVRDAVAPEVVDGDVVALVTYERTASQIIDRSGSVVESAPATPRRDAQLRLIRVAGGWRVQGYRVV